VLKVFHSHIVKADKDMIATEFECHSRESKLCVIFATEALSISVNLPDIQCTILWCIPRGKEPAIA
jgi:hypothetical protein